MPQLHKIECKWRFRTGTRKIKVTPAGSGATILYCTDGWAETFAALVSEIETRLKTVHANFEATVISPGEVRIRRTDGVDFVLDWEEKSLATAVGFDGTQLTGASTYDSDDQSPLVFEASLPWYNDTPGLIYARKAPALFRKTKMAIKIGKIRTWFVTARIKSSEIEQWRKTAGLLSQGIPARWYRNTSDTSAWAWDNFDGYVDVTMQSDADALSDSWPGFPLRQDLEQELAFFEWNNT